MRGAVFFDRDNTLIVDNGHTWKISDFAFLSDSAEALALLNAHQIPVFIATNQSGIARGYFSETDMHKFNQHLIEQVDLKGGRITDIAFCRNKLFSRIVISLSFIPYCESSDGG